MKKYRKLKDKQGHLPGSVSTAWDFWSEGCEFKAYTGCRAYWRKKKKKIKDKNYKSLI